MMFSATDHAHMATALRLAELGRFTCKPNPCVGAVLAHGDTVIGTGWHARAGEPHAEVFALREAGDRARGATAYVTLEPCAHFGRTPPCADALLAAGVTRVVYACADPNPRVSGQGVARLRDAGVTVDAGLMAAAAFLQIEGFLKRMTSGRPFVRLKSATSLDGRVALASGASAWITGVDARADVHQWRAGASAILTGVGTVLADNPRLTARVDAPCVAPLRVVLDSRGRTPSDAAVLDGSAPLLLVCTEHHVDALRTRLPGVDVIGVAATDHGQISLPVLMAVLADRGANDVLVESGGTLAGQLLTEGLIDEWLLYQNACLLGDGGAPVFAGVAPRSMAEVGRWQVIERRVIGDDLRWRLRPNRLPLSSVQRDGP